MTLPGDPHSSTKTLIYGASLESARAAVIMLHGRGASPEDILGIAQLVDPGGVVYLAPAAAQFTWYPNPFLVPQKANQPWLNSALRRVGGLVEQVQAAGITPERLILMGFSQGACLALEYAARHTHRYGGVAGLSGGLIGSEEDLQGFQGSLGGTTVFLGCSDIDPHIPVQRVHQTADILTRLGAQVEVRFYPGMGHMVNPDEIQVVTEMLQSMLPESS